MCSPTNCAVQKHKVEDIIVQFSKSIIASEVLRQRGKFAAFF